MTSLSTHVLDTMHGRPAAGMAVALSGPDGEISRGATRFAALETFAAPGVSVAFVPTRSCDWLGLVKLAANWERVSWPSASRCTTW